MNIPLMTLCATITALALGALFIAHERQHYILAGILKMIASTAFITLALLAGALNSISGVGILLALAFSWWGDLLLLSYKPRYFNPGVVAFLLAHFGFIAAFALAWGIAMGYGAASFIILIGVGAFIFNQFSDIKGHERYLIAGYILIISIMVATAIGSWGKGAVWLVPVGAVLFYISDIFVARQKFLVKSPWNRWLGLPLYYTAQVLLAWSIATLPE